MRSRSPTSGAEGSDSAPPTKIPVERGTLVLKEGTATHRLFTCYDKEILLEGPAGTGKSRCLLELVHMRAEEYPGSRYLLCRKSRSSMPQSILNTFERDVIPPDHEAVRRKVTRTHRTSYNYANGSEVVIGGLDAVEKTFSAEYDMIVVFEAVEISESNWEFLQRCLRNNMIPHPEKPGAYLQQIIADTNPGPEAHWLNQRAKKGKMKRLKARFDGNPTITQEYLETLANMTGHRRGRLYEGKWISAEGQIWDNFNSDRHVLAGSLTRHGVTGRWLLKVDQWDTTIELKWFFAGVDWGFRNPGVLHVYGVDAKRRAFLVHETYMTKHNADWWASEAERLRKLFNVQRFICDPAEPDSIDLFNTRMGMIGGFWIAVGGNNDFLSGSNVVRERLENDSLFFLANCLYTGGRRHVVVGETVGEEPGEDPWRAEASKLTSVVREIPSYTYKEGKMGMEVPEEPAADSEDHGCDTCRYAMVWLDGTDWAPVDAVPEYEKNTFGSFFGHKEVMNASINGY